eukprot:1159618-Pyramimonas_sp.AAC.1
MLSVLFNSGCKRTAGLVITGIDSETAGAFAFRIQSSDLCLLPELGPQNHSYCSSHPERCCLFPALNSGSRGAAG